MLDYQGKLAAYQSLADDYFETERYRSFCETALPHVDEMVLEWIDGPDFASLLHSTIQQTYPPHEWERFEAHFGGLLGMWVGDERRIRGADGLHGLTDSPAVSFTATARGARTGCAMILPSRARAGADEGVRGCDAGTGASGEQQQRR